MINQHFNRVKDLSLMSTDVPAQGWTELIFSVQAEHQDYQIRIPYLSGKIRHKVFRTASNQPWTDFVPIASGQAIR